MVGIRQGSDKAGIHLEDKHEANGKVGSPQEAEQGTEVQEEAASDRRPKLTEKVNLRIRHS